MRSGLAIVPNLEPGDCCAFTIDAILKHVIIATTAATTNIVSDLAIKTCLFFGVIKNTRAKSPINTANRPLKFFIYECCYDPVCRNWRVYDIVIELTPKTVFLASSGSGFFKIETMLVWTVKGNNVYTISFNSEATKYPTYVPIVQKMINTFETANSTTAK
jgi:hypothetical protein